MKFYLLVCFLVIGTNNLKAQEMVSLTVTGQGATQQEARDNALRSSIEQAFGVFVSSNTEILNDELVKDEISTVSSGNIISYDILYENKINDIYVNTLDVIVSVQNLVTYAASKGVSVEVQGGLFAANIRQQQLNSENELIAIQNMLMVLDDMLANSFDVTLNVGNPKAATNNKWDLPLEILINDNENYSSAFEYLQSTIQGLSMSKEEIITYGSQGSIISNLRIQDDFYYLRNPKSLDYLLHYYTEIIFNSVFNFEIRSNDNLIYVEMPSFNFKDLRDPNKYMQRTGSGIRENAPRNTEIWINAGNKKYAIGGDGNGGRIAETPFVETDFNPTTSNSRSDKERFYQKLKWIYPEDDVVSASVGLGIQVVPKYITDWFLYYDYDDTPPTISDYENSLRRAFGIQNLDEESIEFLKNFKANSDVYRNVYEYHDYVTARENSLMPEIFKYLPTIQHKKFIDIYCCRSGGNGANATSLRGEGFHPSQHSSDNNSNNLDFFEWLSERSIEVTQNQLADQMWILENQQWLLPLITEFQDLISNQPPNSKDIDDMVYIESHDRYSETEYSFQKKSSNENLIKINFSVELDLNDLERITSVDVIGLDFRTEFIFAK